MGMNDEFIHKTDRKIGIAVRTLLGNEVNASVVDKLAQLDGGYAANETIVRRLRDMAQTLRILQKKDDPHQFLANNPRVITHLLALSHSAMHEMFDEQGKLGDEALQAQFSEEEATQLRGFLRNMRDKLMPLVVERAQFAGQNNTMARGFTADMREWAECSVNGVNDAMADPVLRNPMRYVFSAVENFTVDYEVGKAMGAICIENTPGDLDQCEKSMQVIADKFTTTPVSCDSASFASGNSPLTKLRYSIAKCFALVQEEKTQMSESTERALFELEQCMNNNIVKPAKELDLFIKSGSREL